MKPHPVLIAPSILDCDFGQLGAQVAAVEEAGARVLHLDVMDGHFVPNLSIGTPVVSTISRLSRCHLESHLMIAEPERYLSVFKDAGSHNITFHIEASRQPLDLITRIHDLGCQAGVALNPATPAEAIFSLIPKVDMILVMTVWPGFGGQRFIEECLPKISEIARRLGPEQILEVDGGVNMQTVRIAVRAGATRLVAGSAIFRGADPAVAFRRLQDEAAAAVGV